MVPFTLVQERFSYVHLLDFSILLLGLPEHLRVALRRGGLIHDIGKLAIPDMSSSNRDHSPRKSENSWQHSVVGERICSPLRSFRHVLPIIRHHHEKWDGSGYPDGLKGEKIPLTARILQVTDVYDALTTDRPYRKSFPFMSNLLNHSCALLYEMLTGQRAFPGKSQLSIVSSILEKEPSPISTVKPLTPPALDHAIRRCLAKDPEDRWQTARDVELELKWIAEAGSQSGLPTSVARQRKLSERLAWASVLGLM